MNNPIKTVVKKLADLSWSELRDIFSWSVNGSTIQAENPNLLVAKATDGEGETIGFVTAENILLCDSYILNPTIAPDEAGLAGDAVENALATQAGVSRMFIVIPPEAPPIGGERRLRVVERKVYQPPTNMQTRVTWEVKEQVASFLIN